MLRAEWPNEQKPKLFSHIGNFFSENIRKPKTHCPRMSTEVRLTVLASSSFTLPTTSTYTGSYSDVLQYCLSISKYSKNVINLFNKYDACEGDVVNIDVIFCKFADSCRFKCVG